MIFYNGEDPATGSAGGCCTAWAVKHGVLASEQQGTIEQGLEMKRASFLHIRATKAGDTITDVRVGGNVVHVIDLEKLRCEFSADILCKPGNPRW